MLSLTGCSSFFGADHRDVEPGFRQQLSPAQKALPLPVEIAQEIAEISENGTIYLAPQDASANLLELRAKDVEVAPQSEELKEEKTENETEIAETQVLPQQLPPKKLLDGKGPLARKISSKNEGPLSMGKILKKIDSKDGKTVTYIVKLGDTLMKIAFEKYGNYLRWKEIYKLNRNKMKHYTKMHVGTELTIENVKYVYVKKEGKPYLIQKGDTLKSIANKIYGTSDKWKEIWRNNPQLIINPKKIYQGFTLYYQDLNQREPAKEK